MRRDSTLNAKIVIALIYALAFVGSVQLWIMQIGDQNRYAVVNTSAAIFLLDRQHGAVWRYYRNDRDKNGNFTEGYSLIKRGDQSSQGY